MRKVLLLTIAALSMLFTQCKKSEVLQPTPTTGEIHISVSVGGGSKADVNPEAGTVTFEVGDVMYVASGGKYAGTLTCEEAAKGLVFRGDITDVKENDYLYFYYLGNKNPETTPVAGSTTSIAVSIADQHDKLPVISAGKSDNVFTSGNKQYSTKLSNKCGLVKFSAAGYTGYGNITIKKMNNKVTVDLSKNLGVGAFTNSQENDGAITLNKHGDDYWAILLPQDAVTGSTEGDAWSLGWKGIFGTVPAISNNNYVTSGVEVNLTNANAVFTVAADKTVTFSPGLLYWDGSSFKFETYQTSFQPTANGTWNENHVNHFFWQPYSRMSNSYTKIYNGTSATDSDILFTNKQESGYESEPNPNFTVNGEKGTWRALTSMEWMYLINEEGYSYCRQGNRFAKANVNGVKGLLIFPDEYNGTTRGNGIAEMNNKGANFPGENIPTETWSAMEAAGVVFLPAAGYRYYETSISLVDSYGYCWSSSPYNNNQAFMIQFENGDLHSRYGCGRDFGLCLRLVR